MKHKQVRNPDGTYTYRGSFIRKGRWDKRKFKGVVWSYKDPKSGLWRTANTLKECKRNIDRFMEFYKDAGRVE